MSKRLYLSLSALLFSLLGPAAPRAEATTLLPMTAEALADQADLIFTGTAVHSEVVLSKDGTFPFTFVTFSVDEALKGSAQGDLTLRFLGGSTGREQVVAEGMPKFKVGERYLLFVTGDSRAASPVVGWGEGQLRFAREPRSGRQILVNYRGVPIRGLEQGKWLAGSPSGQNAGIELLDQEGVTILSDVSDVSPPERSLAKAGTSQTVPAEQVLGSLRSLLRSRAAQKSFKPGRTVESAHPEDVPTGLILRDAPTPVRQPDEN
jgi:hypothetical protein